MASSKESDATADSGEEQLYLLSDKDMDALRNLMYRRLHDCGWRDDIRKMVRSILDERGVNNVRNEEIAAELIPKASKLVPEELRNELEVRILEILDY